MARGRPREFDETQALEDAMLAFWQNGYASTSIDDLVDATGLARQSLYRTFGDKRALFLRALDHYGHNVTGLVIEAIQSNDSPVAGIRSALNVHEQISRDSDRKGCLMANSFGQFTPEDEDVQAVLLGHFERLVRAFQTAIRQGQDEGELSLDANPRALARTLACCVNGLTGLTRIGVPTPYVRDVIRTVDLLLTPP